MSIFDGHENKSPEELANELGISDLSTIKKSKKEITETIENTDSSNDQILDSGDILGIENYDISNENDWCNLEKWNDLEIGMRIKKGDGLIGKIKAIKEGQSIEGKLITIIYPYGGEESFISSEIDIKSYQVYKDDTKSIIRLGTSILEDDNQWIPIYTIEELKRNMKLKNEMDIEYAVILDVDLQNQKITIKINANDIRVYDFMEFYKFYSIYEEDFIKNKMKKLLEKGEFTENYSIDDLEPDMCMIDSLGKLLNIKEISNLAYLQKCYYHPKGTNITYSEGFDNLKKKYKLYTLFPKTKNRKTSPLLGLGQEELNDDSLWESDFEHKDIKLGMRVRKFTKEGGKIVQNDRTGIVIECEFEVVKLSCFEDLEEKYQLYNKDILKGVDIQYLKKDFLSNDNRWLKPRKITNLEVGVRVRKEKILDKPIVGEITEIINDIITINYYNSYIKTLSYEEFEEEGIEISKSDFANL